MARRKAARRGGFAAPWVAALSILCPACGPGALPGSQRPNVIFIVVDTLAATHLSSYGYERKTSPTIDDFAKRGVLFEAAYSQAGYTLPSFAATFTGTYVSGNGLLHLANQVHSSRTTLAELLRANGYHTVGLHAGGFVSPGYGFERGFDEYRRTSSSFEPSDFTTPAIAWLESNDRHPFFLFLHTYDVHSPYGSSPLEYHALYTDPDYVDEKNLKAQANWAKPFLMTVTSASDVEYIRGLYDGEIRYVDDQLRGFFDYLERSGLLETTYVFLFSDHGEEFHEHGDFAHSGCLHPEVVHVPLIVTGPGVVAGRRDRSVTRLIDLFPTLVELLDLDTSGLRQPLDGTSLAGRLDADGGEPEATDTVAISQHCGFFDDFTQLYSVRSSDWSLIRTSKRRAELYDRRADPTEHVDLSDEHPDVVRSLDARYRELTEANPLPGKPERNHADAGVLFREELRALGYLE